MSFTDSNVPHDSELDCGGLGSAATSKIHVVKGSVYDVVNEEVYLQNV